ncbi:MAG TPA: glycerol-3-phosphate dehydrogenase/oxidase, partial [Limnochordales bacterium]
MNADLSASQRLSALRAMAERDLDILVIGGGITGAGVALDAASRGYRVGLVEQADFASGTSSRSTKLVHGGIRYLPQFDFSLVREALLERARLVANAPHLVRPLPFLVPFYQGLRRPLGIRLPSAAHPLLPLAMNTGLWLYDRLAGRMVLMRHRPVSVAEALHLFPYLRRDGLRRASLYYDAQTDDARLTIAVLRTAAAHGALCVNYARATALVREDGRVCGVEVEDRVSGERLRVRARWVVNAAGVWAAEVARLAGFGGSIELTLSKGVHLVLPRELVGLGDAALVLPETEDGRLAFVVPWEGRAILGTTDTPYTGSMEEPPVTDDDVAYLLRHARRFLNVELEPGDLVAAYAGLRPLVSSGGRSADISRRHAVVRHEPGFVSIIGGKLTTYRQMAQDVVDLVVREDGASVDGSARAIGPCRTTHLPLVGA